MSLEEMDRPVHCPENIDRTSWTTMCKLRRDKISMEDALRALSKVEWDKESKKWITKIYAWFGLILQ